MQEVKRRLKALNENLQGEWSDELALSTVELTLSATPSFDKDFF